MSRRIDRIATLQASTMSHQRSAISHLIGSLVLLLLMSVRAAAAGVQPPAANPLPELTKPVNDVANVIDPQSAAEMDRMIRELQEKTGDVVVVATVPSVEPYGTTKEYAVKLFEN